MARTRNDVDAGGAQLLVRLALLGIVIYRPGWIVAAATACGDLWDSAIMPVLTRWIT